MLNIIMFYHQGVIIMACGGKPKPAGKGKKPIPKGKGK
jgi:hypothetical protein